MKEHWKNSQREPRASKRRHFLKQAFFTAGISVLPRYVLGGSPATVPSDKLNIAVIGTGGRGKNDIEAVFKYSDAQVVAVADPNEKSDYSEFYYRGVAGRKPVVKLVNSHYKDRSGSENYPGCAEYIDYRRMLEKEKYIDAVVIATPDHVHAVAAMTAIERGLHLYCEKPLTHSVHETRAVTEAAKKAGIATQMGNQGHSCEGIRRVCEWVWSDAIGKVRQVYSWSDTGYWTGFKGMPAEKPPVPPGLKWDLWIGPAEYRPYHPAYHPYNWRGWWDFGTGAVGDMGCHNMDPAFWALKLKAPVSVDASSTRVNSQTVTSGSIIRYEFPARGDMPPVELTWYDGGLRPPRPEGLPPDKKLGGNGIILKGEKGTIVSGGWGGLNRKPYLFPDEKMKENRNPPSMLPRSNGHMRDWITACKGGRPASSNFQEAGPLVEAVLLGVVAIRTGERIEWDPNELKVTNAPKANRYISSYFREGWSL